MAASRRTARPAGRPQRFAGQQIPGQHDPVAGQHQFEAQHRVGEMRARQHVDRFDAGGREPLSQPIIELSSVIAQVCARSSTV